MAKERDITDWDERDMTNTEDRRRFFRIDDEVDLFYQKTDEMQVTESSHSADDLPGYSLPAALRSLSDESAGLLPRLEKNQPDIARYLKILDDKINLLAGAIRMQSARPEQKNTRNVNLSASGLAFSCEEALAAGDYLELRILLISCRLVIVTDCRVVDCVVQASDDSRYSYLVRVDYVNMKDEERDLLVKHVIKRQMQQLRETRI